MNFHIGVQFPSYRDVSTTDDMIGRVKISEVRDEP